MVKYKTFISQMIITRRFFAGWVEKGRDFFFCGGDIWCLHGLHLGWCLGITPDGVQKTIWSWGLNLGSCVQTCVLILEGSLKITITFRRDSPLLSYSISNI